MHWGLSEAHDLVEKYRKYNGRREVQELNILLFGSGDIRHILQTLANQRKVPETEACQLNFFVVEGCMEVVARNLLLLDTILSEDDSFSHLGRTHLFMDFYGNTFIRSVSREYQRERAALLLQLSTDVGTVAKIYSPAIDLSGLKYRERDQLTDIFSMWKSKKSFDLKVQWDAQLRNYLGERYDSRRGAFDWDLHMELRYRGGEMISNQEYLDFRETGIAFQFPEFEYSIENKSLVVQNHLLTDMHTGPYPAFGLHCEDDEMLKSSHGENSYRATDITERNILKIISLIRTGMSSSYEQLRKNKLGSARFHTGSVLPSSEEEDQSVHKGNHKGLIPLNKLKVHFLSPEMIKNLPDKDQFKNFFDVAFVGAGSYQYLTRNSVDLLKDNGIILFELLHLSLLPKDKRKLFTDNVKGFCVSAGLKLMTNFNLNKHYTTYDYRKEGEPL